MTRFMTPTKRSGRKRAISKFLTENYEVAKKKSPPNKKGKANSPSTSGSSASQESSQESEVSDALGSPPPPKKARLTDSDSGSQNAESDTQKTEPEPETSQADPTPKAAPVPDSIPDPPTTRRGRPRRNAAQATEAKSNDSPTPDALKAAPKPPAKRGRKAKNAQTVPDESQNSEAPVETLSKPATTRAGWAERKAQNAAAPNDYDSEMTEMAPIDEAVSKLVDNKDGNEANNTLHSEDSKITKTAFEAQSTHSDDKSTIPAESQKSEEPSETVSKPVEKNTQSTENISDVPEKAEQPTIDPIATKPEPSLQTISEPQPSSVAANDGPKNAVSESASNDSQITPTVAPATRAGPRKVGRKSALKFLASMSSTEISFRDTPSPPEAVESKSAPLLTESVSKVTETVQKQSESEESATKTANSEPPVTSDSKQESKSKIQAKSTSSSQEKPTPSKGQSTARSDSKPEPPPLPNPEPSISQPAVITPPRSPARSPGRSPGRYGSPIRRTRSLTVTVQRLDEKWSNSLRSALISGRSRIKVAKEGGDLVLPVTRSHSKHTEKEKLHKKHSHKDKEKRRDSSEHKPKSEKVKERKESGERPEKHRKESGEKHERHRKESGEKHKSDKDSEGRERSRSSDKKSKHHDKAQDKKEVDDGIIRGPIGTGDIKSIPRIPKLSDKRHDKERSSRDSKDSKSKERRSSESKHERSKSGDSKHRHHSDKSRHEDKKSTDSPTKAVKGLAEVDLFAGLEVPPKKIISPKKRRESESAKKRPEKVAKSRSVDSPKPIRHESLTKEDMKPPVKEDLPIPISAPPLSYKPKKSWLEMAATDNYTAPPQPTMAGENPWMPNVKDLADFPPEPEHFVHDPPPPSRSADPRLAGATYMQARRTSADELRQKEESRATSEKIQKLALSILGEAQRISKERKSAPEMIRPEASFSGMMRMDSAPPPLPPPPPRNEKAPKPPNQGAKKEPVPFKKNHRTPLSTLSFLQFLKPESEPTEEKKPSWPADPPPPPAPRPGPPQASPSKPVPLLSIKFDQQPLKIATLTEEYQDVQFDPQARESDTPKPVPRPEPVSLLSLRIEPPTGKLSDLNEELERAGYIQDPQPESSPEPDETDISQQIKQICHPNMPYFPGAPIPPVEQSPTMPHTPILGVRAPGAEKILPLIDMISQPAQPKVVSKKKQALKDPNPPPMPAALMPRMETPNVSLVNPAHLTRHYSGDSDSKPFKPLLDDDLEEVSSSGSDLSSRGPSPEPSMDEYENQRRAYFKYSEDRAERDFYADSRPVKNYEDGRARNPKRKFREARTISGQSDEAHYEPKPKRSPRDAADFEEGEIDSTSESKSDARSEASRSRSITPASRTSTPAEQDNVSAEIPYQKPKNRKRKFTERVESPLVQQQTESPTGFIPYALKKQMESQISQASNNSEERMDYTNDDDENLDNRGYPLAKSKSSGSVSSREYPGSDIQAELGQEASYGDADRSTPSGDVEVGDVTAPKDEFWRDDNAAYWGNQESMMRQHEIQYWENKSDSGTPEPPGEADVLPMRAERNRATPTDVANDDRAATPSDGTPSYRESTPSDRGPTPVDRPDTPSDRVDTPIDNERDTPTSQPSHYWAENAQPTFAHEPIPPHMIDFKSTPPPGIIPFSQQQLLSLPIAPIPTKTVPSKWDKKMFRFNDRKLNNPILKRDFLNAIVVSENIELDSMDDPLWESPDSDTEPKPIPIKTTIKKKVQKAPKPSTNTDTYVAKSRPHKITTRYNDVYVTLKTGYSHYLNKCKSLLEKGEGLVYIHGLGQAVNRALELALQLQTEHANTLTISVHTSTEGLSDELVSVSGEGKQTRERNSSSVHITLSTFGHK